MIQKSFIILLLSFGWITNILSQTYFKQELNSSDILIGDHVILTQKSSAKPKDPDPIKQLSELPWMEIIDPGVWILSPQQYYERKIKFSVYDSGYYTVPILIAKIDSSEIQTNPLNLVVRLPLDSTSNIYPIKDIIATESKSNVLLFIILGSLLVVLILVLLYFLFRADKIKTKSFEYQRPLLAHETALKNLIDLENKKLWQSNHIKEYYDELVYILRNFLFEGFKIPALESTSKEIIDHLNNSEIKWQELHSFIQCLHFSDLVKFANKNTEISDHIHWLNFAKSFVIQNKDNYLVFMNDHRQDYISLLGSKLAEQFSNPQDIVAEPLLELYKRDELEELILISSLTKMNKFIIPAQWNQLHKSKFGQLTSWHFNLINSYPGLNGKLLLLFLIPVVAVFMPILFIIGLLKHENIFQRGIFYLSPQNKINIDRSKL